MRFNPDLFELVPKSQLDADLGGDYNFEYDFESYWAQMVEYVFVVMLQFLCIKMLTVSRHCNIAPDGTRVQKDTTTEAASAPAAPGASATPAEPAPVPDADKTLDTGCADWLLSVFGESNSFKGRLCLSSCLPRTQRVRMKNLLDFRPYQRTGPSRLGPSALARWRPSSIRHYRRQSRSHQDTRLSVIYILYTFLSSVRTIPEDRPAQYTVMATSLHLPDRGPRAPAELLFACAMQAEHSISY